ncbi:C-type polyheme cytochrome OmcB [Geobacter sp. FeAm09]|uniref:C-type polyheme cytochrome OmcB n=1 Tax=Geobacter sp. FeAm09 TaxID=2597769 RepID=UPI0011EEAEF5|nr:C-type polyheme cytochrome OmcB [Geobacter sp. FeAm09]QEM69962.1 C-type polyheme cytochrome OmcB [Geobacter sp. FeAm09]
MQIKKLSIMMLLALSSAAFITGCGSSNKEGSASLNDVATVGDTVCIQCHGGSNADSVTGEDKVVEYQRSSPHLGDPGGCEACHGGGAQHYGVGPIPYPSPDVARCQTCHDGKTAPITSAQNYASSQHTNLAHQSGVCIRCHTNEGALLSNMVGLTGGDITPTGGTYSGQSFYNRNIGKVSWGYAYTAINCQTCHEHGAGLRSVYALYSTVSGRDAGKTVWNPSKAAAGSPTGDRQADNKNNQFNLCTSCHNMYDYSGTNVLYSGTAASGTLTAGHHNTSWYRLIPSTHKEKGMTKVTLPYANMSSSATGTNTLITGYVIRKVAPTGAATAADATKTYYTDPYYNGPCFDCHGHEAKTTGATNPTSASAATTIHTDWAQSAHAGMILSAKKVNNGATATDNTDKAMQAYSDDTFMGGTSAWSHYNWDSTLTSAGADDRGSCQKCHTATGFSNFADNPTSYDATRNDFSHLLNWTQKTASGAATGGSKKQNEVLYCWGCHKSAGSGTLRNPGAVTADYTYNGVAVTFPNVGNSNVCVVCHGGRGNTQTARSSRFEGHHGTTAGMLFASVSHIGSEFTGKDYTPPTFFAHDKINATTSGPCASCHMQAAAKHTFSVVSTSSVDGTIAKIRSQAICDSCHTGTYAMTPAKLEEEKTGFTEATNLLIAYLANTEVNAYNTNITTASSTAAGLAALSNAQYSAFQNAKLPADSPGAWAHNRYYAKRLIFDSLDCMQHGDTLTGSITLSATQLAAYPNAATWLGANATTGVAARP